MPSLPNHDAWSLVQPCLPEIHSQTGQRIQPRRFAKNANPYVPQAHSKLFVTHSFTSQPKAMQPSQQCQDKNQCRGGHGLLSQVACFCPVCLSTTATIKRKEIIHITLSTQRTTPLALLETWKQKMVISSLLVPTGLGEGFKSLLEHDSKAHPPFVCPWNLAYMHIQLLEKQAKHNDEHASGFKVSLLFGGSS